MYCSAPLLSSYLNASGTPSVWDILNSLNIGVRSPIFLPLPSDCCTAISYACFIRGTISFAETLFRLAHLIDISIVSFAFASPVLNCSFTPSFIWPSVRGTLSRVLLSPSIIGSRTFLALACSTLNSLVLYTL